MKFIVNVSDEMKSYISGASSIHSYVFSPTQTRTGYFVPILPLPYFTISMEASPHSAARHDLKHELEQDLTEDQIDSKMQYLVCQQPHPNSPAKIQQLVSLLSSALSLCVSDRATIMSAIQELCELSKTENPMVINTIMECGFIPALVKNLQASDIVNNICDDDAISLQYEVQDGCACALGLLASQPEHQQPIIDAGALPCFIDLLRRHKISTFSQQLSSLLRGVANAITNLVHDNTIFKSLFRTEGGIPPLIELLEFNDTKVQRAAARALQTLASENDPNKNQIVESNALPTLVLMLRSEDPKIHYAAVGLIRNLVDCSSPNIKKEVLLAGVLQPIICLLSSSYLECQREAAFLVAEFSEMEADCKVHIAQRGAVPLLVDLLKSSDDVLHSLSAFALGRLAEDSHNQAGIAQSGGIEPLLNLLSSNDKCSQQCAAFALFNIARNEDKVADLIKTGGFQKLKAGHFISNPTKEYVEIMLKRLEMDTQGRVLKQLLYHMCFAEEGVQSNVAIALAYLCSPHDRKTIFIDNNGLEILLDILKCPVTKQKGDASAALHQLAAKACSSVSLFDTAHPSPVARMILGKEYVNNPKYSDVIFLVEGRSFYAHRYWLYSSDVFCAMFDGGYKESEAKHIVILNIKWDAFELMMRYIYTGRVDINLDIAPDLLRAADQYRLDGLKCLCEYTIAQKISVKNVMELYKMSTDSNATRLKHACIVFMLGKFNHLSSTSVYRRLLRVIVPDIRALLTTLLVKSHPADMEDP